jgi:hypothetical protein
VVKKTGEVLQRLYIKASQLWSSDYGIFFALHRNQLTAIDIF